MLKLSIVMPAYDEAENLPEVASRVLAAAQAACPNRFELVIVDDGSTDGTAAAISALGAAHPEVRALAHERNRGLTAALRTGYFAARGEYVLFIPADGQIPPEAIASFMAAAPGHDVVLSNYRHRPDGLGRAMLSRGLRVLLRLALGFGDRADGPYLFRRALLDRMTIVAERSAGSIGFEIAAKARRARLAMATIEIDCLPRRSGRSKVANARNIMQYLVEIARIRRSMRS